MDPATAVTIIAKAADMIASNLKEKKFENWKNSVTSGIDIIIAQNVEILANLRDLRVHITQEAERVFREEHLARLNANIVQFKTYMQSVSKNLDHKLFYELRNDLEENLLLTTRDGPAVYPTVYGAALALISLYEVTNARRLELKTFFGAVISTFEYWSQDVPGHFLPAIRAKQQEAAAKLIEINGFNGGKHVDNYHGQKKEMIPGHGREVLGSGASTDEVIYPSRFETVFCNSAVWVDVRINDQLEVRIENVGTGTNCGGAGFEPDFASTVAAMAQNYKSRVEAQVAAYRALELEARVLQGHQDLLVVFIAKLKQLTQ